MKDVALKINSLTVFGNLKKGALGALKRVFEGDISEKISAYSEFVEQLFGYGLDFGKYLIKEVCEDVNVYSEMRARNEKIPELLASCVEGELAVLQELSEITAEEIALYIGYEGYLPKFTVTKHDFAAEYEARMKSLHLTGYGMFASNVMFRLKDGEIEPVASPDRRGVERLVGYEEERKLILDNTVALVEGRPAANAFLYGDAGTGKSSTIKAIVNMLAPRGLRLVEVRKDQLSLLSSVMEKLRTNPLKFIIFIDDISFNSVDDNFGILKTMLEGSTSVKAPNTVIYATSNRRHLVKESFSDRDGDDVHRNDTVQELSALSARFGLTVLFRSPDKKLYLTIVNKLVKDRNIYLEKEELERQAVAFALRKGGFSPRSAEQFADSLLTITEA